MACVFYAVLKCKNLKTMQRCQPTTCPCRTCPWTGTLVEGWVGVEGRGVDHAATRGCRWRWSQRSWRSRPAPWAPSRRPCSRGTKSPRWPKAAPGRPPSGRASRWPPTPGTHRSWVPPGTGTGGTAPTDGCQRWRSQCWHQNARQVRACRFPPRMTLSQTETVGYGQDDITLFINPCRDNVSTWSLRVTTSRPFIQLFSFNLKRTIISLKTNKKQYTKNTLICQWFYSL